MTFWRASCTVKAHSGGTSVVVRVCELVLVLGTEGPAHMSQLISREKTGDAGKWC